MQKVFVSQVGCDAKTGNAVVLLNAPACEKMLPIWIGAPEAAAIGWAMQEIRPERPLTHQLILNTIEALNYTVEKVEISEIKNKAFLAKLYLLEKNNGLKRVNESELDIKIIDSRPSDAIALALLCSAPIYVSASVLEQAAVSSKELEETEKKQSDQDLAVPLEEDSEFGNFLKDLKASDFKLP